MAMSGNGALDELADEELVALAKASGTYDARAFEALVRRHQAFVAANCRVITRLPNDVDDLAQEVFVKAFFGLRRFEGRAPFRAWLHRVKVNHCLNHLRRTRGAIVVELDDAEQENHAAMTTAPNAELEMESAANHDRIVEVLDAMSDALRLPLMLRDGDGLSYEEIAAKLGLGLSAVKMRIKRGREEFRRRFAAVVARDEHREPVVEVP
jgi:RNA polymerase sigma-70 factor (ECF subfamily)